MFRDPEALQSFQACDKQMPRMLEISAPKRTADQSPETFYFLGRRIRYRTYPVPNESQVPKEGFLVLYGCSLTVPLTYHCFTAYYQLNLPNKLCRLILSLFEDKVIRRLIFDNMMMPQMEMLRGVDLHGR